MCNQTDIHLNNVNNRPYEDRGLIVNQSREDIKITSQTCEVIKTVHQKYIDVRQSRLCSARLEASSGPRSRLTIKKNQRGRRSGLCLFLGGLDKSRHIVPTALIVRVQCFKKDLYKAVEGPSTRCKKKKIF